MNAKEPILIGIADDHVLFRSGMVGMIKEFGDEFRVIYEADEGQSLIDQINANGVEPDICLVDVQMEGMDGFQTTAMLRKLFPSIKVLAVSGNENDYTIVKMVVNGAKGYITKYSKPIEVRTALLNLYNNSFYYSQHVSGKLVQVSLSDKKNTYDLSEREMEFLSYCCSDKTYKEIASEMHLSNRTVEGYRDSLFQKLHLRTRTGLALFAMEMGLQKRGL
ncbi:MAG: response regulator transcription factor [Chitinophagaceae bacterium]|nr:MAG: response regulator transcription factor [Chitinophagaceae bacterium]